MEVFLKEFSAIDDRYHDLPAVIAVLLVKIFQFHAFGTPDLLPFKFRYKNGIARQLYHILIIVKLCSDNKQAVPADVSRAVYCISRINRIIRLYVLTQWNPDRIIGLRKDRVTGIIPELKNKRVLPFRGQFSPSLWLIKKTEINRIR